MTQILSYLSYESCLSERNIDILAVNCQAALKAKATSVKRFFTATESCFLSFWPSFNKMKLRSEPFFPPLPYLESSNFQISLKSTKYNTNTA